MKKQMKIALAVPVLLIGTLFMSGCSAPTPEQDLLAAVAALDIVSALPNLTPADRAWISAAANGLSCSSTVLAQGISVAQEGIAIAACFSALPAVPPADQVYIQAGIAAVDIFIALYEPAPPVVAPTLAAIKANESIRLESEADRARFARVAAVHEKVRKISLRLGNK